MCRIQQLLWTSFGQHCQKGNVQVSGENCPGSKGTNMYLRGLLPKNLQNVAKGGTAPRLVVPTMTICGP